MSIQTLIDAIEKIDAEAARDMQQVIDRLEPLELIQSKEDG